MPNLQSLSRQLYLKAGHRHLGIAFRLDDQKNRYKSFLCAFFVGVVIKRVSSTISYSCLAFRPFEVKFEDRIFLLDAVCLSIVSRYPSVLTLISTGNELIPLFVVSFGWLHLSGLTDGRSPMNPRCLGVYSSACAVKSWPTARCATKSSRCAAGSGQRLRMSSCPDSGGMYVEAIELQPRAVGPIPLCGCDCRRGS